MKKAFLLAALLSVPLPAIAAWQSLEQIRATAEAFVVAENPGVGVSAQAGALDSRLKLTRCDGPLEAFRLAGTRATANMTVGVRCTGQQPWKLYVPVRTRISGQVLVARRALSRGQTLGEADVELVDYDLSKLPYGYLQTLAEAGGQVLRKSATPGTVILPSMLNQANAVRRGQRVTLVSSRNGVRIAMAGKALSDGAVQQRIRVENLSSGRIVEGLVRSGEEVEIMSR